MNWYKKAQGNQDNIRFLEGFSDYGANFVVFKIGDKYFKYQLSFPDWIDKVKKLASYSSGKALAWTKKKATATWEVTSDYFGYGSVIREITENENEEDV